MRRALFPLSILMLPVAVAAVAIACASGGSSGGSSSDGGDDADLADGQAGDAPGDARTADSPADGPGVSAAKGCQDYLAGYCNQLSMCSPFLLQTQYGLVANCQTQLQPLCNDLVAAPGSGWTGAGLEACLAKHNSQSCSDFLYAKPTPKECAPTGTLSNAGCRYDAQCGTGYCRIPAGATCGNCVQRGTTGALCTGPSDCDGDLMCNSMGTCAPPAVAGVACSATTPCAYGLACVAGVCAVALGDGGTCGQDGGGNACDYNLGYYCSGTACTAINVAMSTGSCSATPPAVCFGSGYCSTGFCTPPVQDGNPCEGGVCAAPSTCNMGTCGLALASQCH